MSGRATYRQTQGQAAIEALLIVALGFTLALAIHHIGQLRSNTLYLLGESHFLSFLPARMLVGLDRSAPPQTKSYATVHLADTSYSEKQSQIQRQLGFDSASLLQASAHIAPTLGNYGSLLGLNKQAPLVRHSFLLSGYGHAESVQAAQMQVLGSAVLWQESFSLSKQLVDNSVLTLQNIDQIWGRTPLTADWVLPWANELLVSESLGHASVLNEPPTVSRALGHSLK
jgi:hypothetical protein